MSVTTLVLILVLLAAIWWLLRMRRQATQADDKRGAKQGSVKQTDYHAVSIRFEANACAAARAMAGRRFLATAAPRLPLPDCNVLECRCRFVHHADRRSGKDRRSPFAAATGRGADGSYKQENRVGGDRRQSDDHF